MSEPILICDKLSRVVSEDSRPKTLLHPFTYSFHKNQIYSIIGPSGAGKSTLLRLLNRLDEPSGGEVLYRGQKQCDFSPTEFRRKIGYLFQTPHLFETTVRDNLLYAESELDDSRQKELIEEVRLPSTILDQTAERLSIGEKQRVALARLLATNPEIILLDEPTSALDPTVTEKIEKLIIDIVKSENLTAIIVTHNPQQSLRFGGEGLLLATGELVESGPVEQLINQPKSSIGQQYKERRL